MHIYLKHPVLAVCPKCGKKLRPHTVCPNCGYYKKNQVIDVTKKLSKKEKKQKEKEIAEKEEKKEKPLTMEGLSKK